MNCRLESEPESGLKPTRQSAVPNAEYDLVIIGGGLAGFSLACWLLQLAEEGQATLPTVCFLEPRISYSNDRTWCFWDLEPHPFRDLITHRWFRWQVSQGSRIACQSDGNAAYAMLPADVLYRHALAKIAGTPAFDLHLGVTVSGVEYIDGGALVSADQRCWQAKAVIDTRPPDKGQFISGVGFWQVFSGLEITCPKHGFDTSTATLMDFQSGYPHPCFLYLLPLDEDHFLIEWTAFQPEKEPAPDYRSDLDSWLQRQGLGYYEVTREESGSLPMLRMPNVPNLGRVVRAGVGAGWMRAATGYHFVSCQKGSAALARQILAAHASGDWMLQGPTVRAGWLDWMDSVFLRALKRHPDKAPQWFVGLFSATSAAQMSRFMNDQPRWRDALAVASALPLGPFARAALPW
ncbi:MAG: lycopene cyclase family protein [Marinobacter sp.]